MRVGDNHLGGGRDSAQISVSAGNGHSDLILGLELALDLDGKIVQIIVGELLLNLGLSRSSGHAVLDLGHLLEGILDGSLERGLAVIVGHSSMAGTSLFAVTIGVGNSELEPKSLSRAKNRSRVNINVANLNLNTRDALIVQNALSLLNGSSLHIVQIGVSQSDGTKIRTVESLCSVRCNITQLVANEDVVSNTLTLGLLGDNPNALSLEDILGQFSGLAINADNLSVADPPAVLNITVGISALEDLAFQRAAVNLLKSQALIKKSYRQKKSIAKQRRQNGTLGRLK